MTSGKAGGLKDSEPLKAVEALAAFRRLVATWYTQPLGFGRLAGLLDLRLKSIAISIPQGVFGEECLSNILISVRNHERYTIRQDAHRHLMAEPSCFFIDTFSLGGNPG
jgi:hypothetical protein